MFDGAAYILQAKTENNACLKMNNIQNYIKFIE